jgi:hypothetical protein
VRRTLTPIILIAALFAAVVRAAEVADRSTPKAAAVTLYKAVAASDRDAIAASFYAADDEQRTLAEAMADFIVAGRKLGDAAKARFAKGSDPIGRGMIDPADLSKLDEATVKQSAVDAAVMTVPGQPRPMSFRQQDGQWRLVVTDFAGAAPANIAKQTRLVQQMAAAIDAAAADIAAGKFKTPEEATNAIQGALHQVMLSFYRPSTTRATTGPATTTSATRP